MSDMTQVEDENYNFATYSAAINYRWVQLRRIFKVF